MLNLFAQSDKKKNKKQNIVLKIALSLKMKSLKGYTALIHCYIIKVLKRNFYHHRAPLVR